MIRILRESLEAMVEEHAIMIVSKYCIGQRGVKVGAMDLMIGSAESLDIISSACPDFYYLACLEMAYQVRFGGPGFFGDPIANAKKVERMHRIRRDYYTCSNLAKFPRLLENRNAIAEMLQCKRRTQTTNAASYYGNPRDFHRHLPAVYTFEKGSLLSCQKTPYNIHGFDRVALQFLITVGSTDFCRCQDGLR
jgi:hypothetical protein